ncbi:MAG: hypothetical protein AAF512_05425 [Pseudomonadota bacterium]
MNTFEKLQRIVEIIEKSELDNVAVGDAKLKLIMKNIEESPFYETEGDTLTINCLYHLLPDSCRLIGLPDEHLCFMAVPVLEAMTELSPDKFVVDDLDAYDSGYDEDNDDDSGTWWVSFELNGNREKFTFDVETVGDPKSLVDALVNSRLAIRHKFLRKNILASYTLWDIYDEYGAALLCYLPQPIAEEIKNLIRA